MSVIHPASSFRYNPEKDLVMFRVGSTRFGDTFKCFPVRRPLGSTNLSLANLGSYRETELQTLDQVDFIKECNVTIEEINEELYYYYPQLK